MLCAKCGLKYSDKRECNEKPENLLGAPTGMYHCPDCGEMVLAGLPHPYLCEKCTDEAQDLKNALGQTVHLSGGLDENIGCEQIKALNIYQISSSPAPKEWQLLPEVAKQKPKSQAMETSLSRLDGTNIVIWYYRTLASVYWKPYGDLIIIIEPHGTGLRDA